MQHSYWSKWAICRKQKCQKQKCRKYRTTKQAGFMGIRRLGRWVPMPNDKEKKHFFFRHNPNYSISKQSFRISATNHETTQFDNNKISQQYSECSFKYRYKTHQQRVSFLSSIVKLYILCDFVIITLFLNLTYCW